MLAAICNAKHVFATMLRHLSNVPQGLFLTISVLA